MATVEITELEEGERFIGPDGNGYEVTVPASEDPNGWVHVRDLTISDEDIEDDDPSTGFYAYSCPVYVEAIED